MIIKLPNFNIKEFSKPFLVAEIGSNFNGSMELAEKMILSAKSVVQMQLNSSLVTKIQFFKKKYGKIPLHQSRNSN